MTDAVTRYLQDTRRAATRTVEAVIVSRLGQVMGLYQGLPELRGFWPFSSINENAAALDLSGQGRTLTNNGVSRAVITSGLPVSVMNGASQYWSRASEAGLNITGALTILAWFNTSTNDAVARYLAQKDGYALYFYNGTLSFQAIGATSGYISNGAVVTNSIWHFVAARFTPSTNVKLTVDGMTYTSTATIPAALNTGGSAFQTGTSFAGNLALLAICAAALSDAQISQIYNATHGLFGV